MGWTACDPSGPVETEPLAESLEMASPGNTMGSRVLTELRADLSWPLAGEVSCAKTPHHGPVANMTRALQPSAAQALVLVTRGAKDAR
jgi:hypothetical protein